MRFFSDLVLQFMPKSHPFTVNNILSATVRGKISHEDLFFNSYQSKESSIPV